MDETVSDLDLVKEVRAGKTDSFAQLMRRHHARVLAQCAAILYDSTQAEDAAQEVFFKAYRSLPKFQAGSTFSTWLYRIAVNHCLDMKRGGARRPTESWDALVEKEGGAIERLVTEPEAPAADDADLVRRVLDCLSPEYKLILTLREMQGLDYREIMAALDCSLDAVKARLWRARQSFRDRMRHILRSENV